MERKRVVAVVVATVALSFAFAEEGAAQGQGSPSGPRQFGPRHFGPARQRWHQMSPEDRMHFQSNAARWLQLPPEERQHLRLREGVRRQRLQQEAQDALQSSGLQLEAERREMYERRYLQERRRIERALRQEMEEKRQRELAPVMEGLKKEFAQPQNSANPSLAPSGTPAPKK